MEKETCKVCGNEVTVQIMKGTDLCGDICRKRSVGELPPLNEIDPILMPGMTLEGVDPNGIS